MDYRSIPCPMHPGRVLRFHLDQYGIGYGRAAELLHVPKWRIYALVRGRGRITAVLALRLGRLLPNTAQLWMPMQCHYDVWKAVYKRGDEYASIEPF